ncbi:MAG: bifunctional hydroxymethylpyrimidine kinase/phosphomethylpyrimidine kinase [Myxococcaceae bacterium]|nr:bifunctional hydroxymethylpyrimidine kinase/phosphomethylpyrimidine kinase [Myxococcaceae bacterium]
MSPPQPTLVSIARAFPKKRILVIGDLVADHYIFGETDRISREAPVLIVRYERSEVKLGGGANAAANVRSLGGQVTVVGALGRDEMGRRMRRLFGEVGISVRAASGAGVETETKTRIYAGGVNTKRQQMLRLDRGARTQLPQRVRAALAREVARAARDADAVLVSDYGAGVVGDEVRGVLKGLSRDGLPVCVDSRYALREFVGFGVCKPNEPELEQLLGIPVRTEADLLRAGAEARRRLECGALVVTRGRSGMAVFTAEGARLIAAHGDAEAVDVTGAGDTVIAALTLSLAAGADVERAARIANVAGALVVQKPGTATVAHAELISELVGHATIAPMERAARRARPLRRKTPGH